MDLLALCFSLVFQKYILRFFILDICLFKLSVSPFLHFTSKSDYCASSDLVNKLQ